jgi:hypothetical protein
MIRFLYKLVHNIVVWVAPILLVLTSIVLALPQAQLHKSTLASGDFYPKLSAELNPENNSDYALNLQSIVLRSVFEGLANETWLKDVFERNVDQIVGWLDGDNENLELYLPNDQIEENIKSNINDQVSTLIEQKGSEIKPCNEFDSNNIREIGFRLNGDFCLPPSVLSGQENLLSYMGLDDDNINNNFLDSFFRNNQLKDDTISPTRLDNENNIAVVLTYLGYIRDFNLAVKNNLLVIWLVFLILVSASIILSRYSGKTYLGQLQRLTIIIGINTISICVFLLLIIGGTNYLTNSISGLIFPGIISSELNNLIILKVLHISFNFLLFALVTSVVLIGIRIAISVMKSSGVIANKTHKNNKIASHLPNIDKNYTHDGQFKKELNQKIPEFSESQSNSDTNFSEPSTPTLSDYPKDQSYKYFVDKPNTNFEIYTSKETLDFSNTDTFQTSSSPDSTDEVQAVPEVPQAPEYSNTILESENSIENSELNQDQTPEYSQNPYIEIDKSINTQNLSNESVTTSPNNYTENSVAQNNNAPSIPQTPESPKEAIKVKIAVVNPENPENKDQTPTPKRIIGL